MATKPVTPNPAQRKQQPQSPSDQALLELGDKIFKRDSKNRHAEDRAWFQAALFYQLKQWITSGANGRWEIQKNDPKKPIPMPVSDYFSKTINANSNSLGAAIPEMIATPNDQNSNTRRAATAAENAFDEMDKESGMDILNPIAAKHCVLWGLACTKETVDMSESAGMMDLPGVDLTEQSVKICPNCGYMSVGQQPGQLPEQNPLQEANKAAMGGVAFGDPGPQPDQLTGEPAQELCPDCGSPLETETLHDLAFSQGQSFAKGKLCTEVVPILEIYLPRDCRDPNLAKRITHKYRKPKEESEDLYPDAGELPTEGRNDASQFYMESLRGLVMGTMQSDDMVSFTEIWADWTQLNRDTREAIEQEWGNEPSNVIGYDGMTRLQAAKRYGIYWIFVKDKVLVKSENPWDGKKCFTFYPWEKDPASPYPKGLAVPLIPKQKQLNRLDCMMELSEQTNGVGKLMAPIQQMSNFKPTGNPVDVYWYDGADGKQKPEFTLPNPYGPALPSKRAALIQDFRELGYTQGVSQGDNPGGGVNSFRGIAYLGAKAEENIQTQRFLWEQGHKLRKELLLIMARKVWDDPRKARVAGFNGKFGMMELTGDSLMGDYGIDVRKGSSRPKTREEKLNSLQIAASAGLVNMQDPQTREYALDELDITEVDQADHYNYTKVDRDLEKLKQGLMPFESPFQKWDIWVQTLGMYTLTEEFEELDPAIQHGILMYCQYCSDKLAAVTQGIPPDPLAANRAFAAAVHGGNDQNPLNGIPGQTQQTGNVESAVQNQGNAFASKVSPASPA
jgi:hypothetical protein